MTLRVAVAGVFHETNTFSPVHTDLDGFRHKLLARGDELVAAYAGTRTVVGGFLDGTRTAGLDVVPASGAYARPAGVVTDAAFEAIVADLTDALLRAMPFDGLLLELHGAMVTERLLDPETHLLATVREVVGDRPIVAVTDLHANMTAERLELVDVLTGYRTNPHTDTYERGVTAAAHLAALIRDGLQPVTAHRHVPVLAAPVAQATADEPLRTLLDRACELEQRGLADITVHGGYAYADVPHAGLAFTATGWRNGERAHEAVDELATVAWQRREALAVQLAGAGESFEQARTRAGDDRPVAIADTGDNIGGGAPGDGTWLLREALAHPGGRVAATITDPAAVEAAARVGAGGRLRWELGGWSSELAGPPIAVEATVRWLGDGTFINKGPMGRGARTTMGRCATLSTDGLDVIVQSLPVQPNDPELFRCAGLDPLAYTVVVLKGAAALRAGWRDLARDFVHAGTPGVTDSNLARLPYQRVRRPIWPLDPG